MDGQKENTDRKSEPAFVFLSLRPQCTLFPPLPHRQEPAAQGHPQGLLPSVLCLVNFPRE